MVGGGVQKQALPLAVSFHHFCINHEHLREVHSLELDHVVEKTNVRRLLAVHSNDVVSGQPLPVKADQEPQRPLVGAGVNLESFGHILHQRFNTGLWRYFLEVC